MNINPNAIIFLIFTTLVGYLLGNWAIGAAIGSGLVLIASFLK